MLLALMFMFGMTGIIGGIFVYVLTKAAKEQMSDGEDESKKSFLTRKIPNFWTYIAAGLIVGWMMGNFWDD